MRITAENFVVQEGARRFDIAGGNTAIALGNLDPVDIDRETNADIMMLFTVKVAQAPSSAVLSMIDASGTTASTPVAMPVTGDYVRYGIPLKCFRDKGLDVTAVSQAFVLTTSGAADFNLGEVRLGMDAEQVLPCG